ncbi:DUF6325 family protein [Conexibacter woesei]|uniref:DUF6325 family protein n=1 Tax=Conexibacter woesei TaxID=191495 RepID=UPI000414FD7D|nr:DUF6325 family protein [Conexibacter woesei]
MSETTGPVDVLAIEIDRGDDSAVAAALGEAVAAGTIHIIDMLVVSRDEDGAVESVEITDLDAEAAAVWTALDGDVHGLVNDEDVAAIAEAVTPGRSAVLVVYEHLWARPVAAAIDAGNGRIAVRHHVDGAEAASALSSVS